MLRRMWIVFPLVLVLMTSGCTSVCDVIPVPGICGGETVFADNVVVITSLEALPNKVSPGQQIKLQSYVRNDGNKEIAFNDKDEYGGVKVVLYDTCGVFSVTTGCSDKENIDKPESGLYGCKIGLLPKQTKPVSWTLVADSSTRLLTKCDLKVFANYNYTTESVSSITFIDYTEYQKMLDEGTFQTISSYITEGYGPVKPYLTVEDPQPIPVEREKPGTVTLGFQVKNRGSGSLSGENAIRVYSMDATKIGGEGGYYIIDNAGKGSENPKIYTGIKTCIDENIEKNGLRLINKESPKVICPVPVPSNINLPKQSTIHVTSEISYGYMLFEELEVVIEPKI